MQYKLVYDAAAAGYTDWWFPAIGLGIAVIIAISVYTKRRDPGLNLRIALAALGLVLLLGWIQVFGLQTFRSFRGMRNALENGSYTVVEGVVENFVPSDAGDHTEERWQVTSNGTVHEYHYVRSRLTPGFRQTAVHGGPIRSGLRVRIADVDGYIARLEIAN